MEKITLSFYECEHDGDLENYKEDICACGGKILQSRINYEAEIGTVQFEVEDKQAFIAKFKETESYGLLD